MPAGSHFPSGDIFVLGKNETDITKGMRWVMPDADDVRFLAVNGPMAVGDFRAKYDFTLVEYTMHIDEVPWTLFSTLDNALENEFTEAFWKIINWRRKGRPEFLDVPWIDTKQAYDVSKEYTNVRVSTFDKNARTAKVSMPFHVE